MRHWARERTLTLTCIPQDTVLAHEKSNNLFICKLYRVLFYTKVIRHHVTSLRTVFESVTTTYFLQMPSSFILFRRMRDSKLLNLSDAANIHLRIKFVLSYGIQLSHYAR